MDVSAWFYSLPPITRTWFGVALALNAAATLELIDPHDLLFDRYAITNRLELWRIATSFLYGGGPLNEFYVLISLYLITIHSRDYERNPHCAGGSPRADYVFCLLFCITITIGTYLITEYFVPRSLLYPLFTRTILHSITYLWARRNPNLSVTLYFIPIQALYLPYAYIVISLVLGNPIHELLHGMLVGHVYYFVVQIIPTVLHRRILTTPIILEELINSICGDGSDEEHEFRQDFVRINNNNNNNNNNNSNNNNDNIIQRRFQQDGATEAHIAAKLNQLDRLRTLAQSAEGRQQFVAKDRNDWQPLHEAVRGGHIDVVNYLFSLECGVDKNARTMGNRGPSPLWMAEQIHGLEHPVTLRLQELGAVKVGPE